MPRAGLTPERLALAGAELADEIGFEHVTLSALARRFDVKVGSLYHHVASSQDLQARIALLALAELADRGAEALAGRAGRDALVGFANAFRDYAQEHPGRWSATRFPLGAEDAAASAGARHAQMLRAILRGYDLSEPEATDAVRLIGSVFHGYVTLELAGGFSHSAPSSQDSWDRILNALDDQLLRWPTNRSPKGRR